MVVGVETRSKLSHKELEDLYLVNKLSYREIASRHNLAYRSVANLIKLYGIRPRTLSEAKINSEGSHDNNRIHIAFTPEQEQVFLGTMFGDGHLQARHEGSNASFRDAHCIKDRDYIFWKYKVLESSGMFLRPCKLHESIITNYGTTSYWRFHSRSLPLLTEYHKLFYPNGKKVVPEELLGRLNELGLTVWYMDDGCLGLHGGGSGHQLNLKLSTHSFTYEENNLIRDWIEEKFGITFRVGLQKGRYWYLCLTGNSRVNKFLEITRPYAVPCMARKWRNN